MYHLKIKIPGLPKTTNAIHHSHWAEKSKEAQYWKQCVMAFSANKKPSQPLKKAQLILTRFSSTMPDPDGLVSSFKHSIDGLILARIIENDRFDNIGMPDYKWKKEKRGKGWIQIEVFEVSGRISE